MAHTACLVGLVSTVSGHHKNALGRGSISSRQITKLEQSTFILISMVTFSALFTFWVGWHPSAVNLPPGDVIFAQLACPLNDIIFSLHWE
jgi:hypothetical protein